MPHSPSLLLAERFRRQWRSGKSVRKIMEYEDATRIYRKKLTESDRLFRLAPAMPSPALSHREDETWYLRDGDGRLIARVSPSGVRLG